MKVRASNVMIGTLTLALIAGSLGAWLGYQKLAGIKQKVPFRVVFEGSASGLRKGGSVNFAGIRVGEVVSLKLDHPRRVVALAMIDGNTPVKSDTQVGLEFRGLTGIAAISFTGGSDEAPPPPKGADGIPELTADRDGTLNTQEKIRVALRNVDKVIADNEVAIKDTLRNFESFTASLSGNGERISSIIATAESGVAAVDGAMDGAMDKTKNFLSSLASDKYGGELLPTVISMRELIESFDKKSGQVLADARKMLGEVSASINNTKPAAPPRRR
jgi:phospholipid/cholesterol/gamma-HCH transport system substrate-binding protein